MILIFIGVILIIIPILLFFIQHVIPSILFNWLKKNKIKTDRTLRKHWEEQNKKIYEQEYKPYYLATVRLFKCRLQNKQINRKQILQFKKLVDKSLGSYVSTYKDWKFKNDAMEIYTKLKDTHLDKSDFQLLMQYLKN